MLDKEGREAPGSRGYKYFGAKGLVVMAKNFYGLKDSFQATYILDSVIKNFSAFPDVVEEAQKELDVIKMEEAKTNSSVSPLTPKGGN